MVSKHLQRHSVSLGSGEMQSQLTPSRMASKRKTEGGNGDNVMQLELIHCGWVV